MHLVIDRSFRAGPEWDQQSNSCSHISVFEESNADKLRIQEVTLRRNE